MQLVFLLSINLHLVYMLSKEHVDRTSIIFLLFSVLYSVHTKKSTLFSVQCGVHVCVCVGGGGGGEDPHRLT